MSNYPEGVTDYDIDKAFGPCCVHCNNPVYAGFYEMIDGEYYCTTCADEVVYGGDIYAD